ncbi:hypothetical protein GCM10028825_13850 [Spirosoma agri]
MTIEQSSPMPSTHQLSAQEFIDVISLKNDDNYSEYYEYGPLLNLTSIVISNVLAVA